jgi:hypothetical protein
LRCCYSTPGLSHSQWSTCRTWRRPAWAVPNASGRETGSGTWRQGHPMMTSNASSSFGELAAAPIYRKEEDIPATGPVVVVAPPAAAIASTTKTTMGIGTSVSCPAPTTETWGPPSSEVPWALDFWGGGVMFMFDALGSRSKGSINPHTKKGEKRKSSKMHNIPGALIGSGGTEPLARRVGAAHRCHQHDPLSHRLQVWHGFGSLLDVCLR